MVRHVILITFIQLCSIAISSAQFSVSTSRTTVPEGESFTIQFTLEGERGTQFRAPSFKDFKVISGPNMASQYSNNNGRVSMFSSYSYEILATSQGVFTIGPASIRSGNNQYTTESINIRVTEPKPTSKATIDGESDFFARLEVADTIAHVGQQILLQLKIYSRVPIKSYKVMSEPAFDAFYRLEARNPRAPAKIVNIDGQDYNVHVVKNIPLFPLQTGTYRIDPLQLSIGLPGKRRSNSFFFSSTTKQVPASTNPITIKVQDLPDNAPRSFSGAIGTYSIRTGIDKNNLSTDDAITLQIVITGNGDPRMISAPEFDIDDRFEVYDPSVNYESKTERYGMQFHNTVFEYLLVPLEPGSYELSPEFSYYDPDSMDYITLKEGPFRVAVTKGRLDRNLRTTKIKLSEKEIAPVMLKTRLKPKDRPLLENPAVYGLLGLPLFSFLGIFFWKKRRDAEAARDPEERRRSEARKKAMKHLGLAQEQLNAKDEKRFYKAISDALLGFVSDKLGLETADITKSNVRKNLEQLQISELAIGEFMKILQASELALYGASSPGGMEDHFEKVRELLTTIESSFREQA